MTQPTRSRGALAAADLQGAVEMAAQHLTGRPLLVVTDFDGTVSRISDDPWGASILPLGRRALRALAGLPKVHVVVLSGRTARDAARFILFCRRDDMPIFHAYTPLSMKNYRGWFAASAALLLAPLAMLAQSAPRIPLEAFFAEADIRSMQLAPDGKHLAFLTTLGWGKVGVALMDLATGKVEPLVSAQDENIKIFLWKGSDYIVYAGDTGGDESYAWRSVPIAEPRPGKKRVVVALSEAYRERYQEDANVMSIIDPLKFDPQHLLISGRSGTGSRACRAGERSRPPPCSPGTATSRTCPSTPTGGRSTCAAR